MNLAPEDIPHYTELRNMIEELESIREQMLLSLLKKIRNQSLAFENATPYEINLLRPSWSRFATEMKNLHE